jgi:hypothetical protein
VWDVDALARRTRVVGGAPALPDAAPARIAALDVNALNFCRFALLPLPREAGAEAHALVAVPNLIDSSMVRGALIRLKWRALKRTVGGRVGAAVRRAATRCDWEGG